MKCQKKYGLPKQIEDVSINNDHPLANQFYFAAGNKFLRNTTEIGTIMQDRLFTQT